MNPTPVNAFKRRWWRQLVYHFDRTVLRLTGTNRHCYVHPEVEAVAFEGNTQDRSYRRPICVECAG